MITSSLRGVDIPVDEDFSKVSHSHWQKATKWTDMLVLLVLLVLPVALHQGVLFAANDHLLSLTAYLASLVVLGFAYTKVRRGMHLDVFYISSVSKPTAQICRGVVWGIFGGAVPILLLFLSKRFGYDFSHRIHYLLPFGVEPKSWFPRAMRVVYLVFWGLQFSLVAPLIEARYYLVLLRKTASNTCITLLIFGLLLSSHFYLVFDQVWNDMLVAGALVLGLALLFYLVLAIILRRQGVIAAIFFHMGTNLGLTVALGFLLLSRRFAPPLGLNTSQFSERNIWEVLFRGVIQKASED